MYCIFGRDLPALSLPKNHILQEGVKNLELIDGKKFTSRVYALLWNKACWLYHDGFVLVHGTQYTEDSTDYSIHIDHRGYHLPDSPVIMESLRSHPATSHQWQRIRGVIEELTPALQDCINQSSRTSYTILGIDFLTQKGGDIKILEINTMPNFIHSKKINETVNIGLFHATMQKLLGFDDNRLEKM